MSAVSRVSAFAKRRKLDDGSSTPSTLSDASSSAPLVKKVKVKRSAAQRSAPTADVLVSQSDSGAESLASADILNENSFGPLVDANVVAFTGTRELEQVDERTCKVRLSRGQKCTIQGIAKLWVRDGSVSIGGAICNESVDVQTVSSSPSGSLLEIVARTKTSEFQLESLTLADEPFPSTTNIPGKLGEQIRQGPMSFRVLSQVQDERITKQDATDDPTTKIWHIPLYAALDENNKSVELRMLVCGKRSADTHRASVASINRLLTDKANAKRPDIMSKIAFLDLDYISPAFAAPGTLSLSVISRPILDAPHVRPLQSHIKTPNRLVTRHYIRAVEHSEKPTLDLLFIERLLTAHKIPPTTPLVIRTGSWLASTSSSNINRLQTMLQTNLTLCVDTNKSSPHYEAGVRLSTATPDSFIHFPVSPQPTSTLLQHKLMLQSHFRLHSYVEDMPLWYPDPIPDIPSRKVVLPMTPNKRGGITFLEVRGGTLRPQDIPAALERNLVVLVAAHVAEESDPSRIRSLEEGSGGYTDQDSEEDASILELREADDIRTLVYIGLAYVENIDLDAKRLTLNTPVSMDYLQIYVKDGYEIGLVLEKPGADGRFGRHLLFG